MLTNDEIVVELYKEFLDTENKEHCVVCQFSYVGKDGFYVCSKGNFHQCCCGVGCGDFIIRSYIEACHERIKELKNRIEDKEL